MLYLTRYPALLGNALEMKTVCGMNCFADEYTDRLVAEENRSNTIWLDLLIITKISVKAFPKFVDNDHLDYQGYKIISIPLISFD
jgi:hypothetical protein